MTDVPNYAAPTSHATGGNDVAQTQTPSKPATVKGWKGQISEQMKVFELQATILRDGHEKLNKAIQLIASEGRKNIEQMAKVLDENVGKLLEVLKVHEQRINDNEEIRDNICNLLEQKYDTYLDEASDCLNTNLNNLAATVNHNTSYTDKRLQKLENRCNSIEKWQDTLKELDVDQK